MKCAICKKDTDYLEDHHIIPKSRGGSDDKDNLIKICIGCHSDAHGVEFTRNGSGLVKEVQKRYKEKLTKGNKWIELDQNKKKIHDLLMEIYDEYGKDKWYKVFDLIERSIINSFDLMNWAKTGELCYYIRRKKFTIDL